MFIWKCKITHLKLFDCLHKSYYFRKETIPSFDKTTPIPLLWLNKTHSKEGLRKCVAVKTWKSYFLKTSVQTTPVLKKESKMEENWQIKFMKKRLNWKNYIEFIKRKYRFYHSCSYRNDDYFISLFIMILNYKYQNLNLDVKNSYHNYDSNVGK